MHSPFAFMAMICLCTSILGHAQDRERAAEPSSPAKWYGQAVRETEGRTPQQELAGFHVPDGFTVELVASEPQIRKPMNLAFDRRGRLWVTQTEEYPYPAQDPTKAKDQIRILEDVDQDGVFEKVSVFAEGLNIPIGILPYQDGCICFSIPNILFLRDSDSDGKADSQQILLGPFDTTRDTHGMVNSLIMGLDGWVYANHGYNNQSTVAGKDGHSVAMTSGNTFRFKPDGSRVEIVTKGQVNPFGACHDVWGTRFTADCHSVPITQLLPGGCYPSFGRPDDGIGFAPAMMEHLHGSTAIAGLEIGEGSLFPSTFQQNFFSGNVMTSRINRNKIVRQGATVRAVELPDLLTSDDPCFRPVDLRFGPDGCLYVADFYNRVIGHYEVPLDHPARDRTSGRIFRIRYGSSVPAAPKASKDLEKWETPKLVEALSHPNPWLRQQAVELLIERENATSLVEQLFKGANDPSLGRAMAAWVYFRKRGQLPDGWEEVAKNADALLRNHLALAVASGARAEAFQPLRPWLQRSSQQVDDACALRSIIEASGTHGVAEDIKLLLPFLEKTTNGSPVDPVLSHAARIAMRKLLQKEGTVERLFDERLSERIGLSLEGKDGDLLIPILLGLERDVPIPKVVAWLAAQRNDQEKLIQYLPQLALIASLEKTSELMQLYSFVDAKDVDLRSELLQKIARSQVQRHGKYSELLERKASELCRDWVARFGTNNDPKQLPRVASWMELGERRNRPWPIQARAVQGSTIPAKFFSSFGNGEEYVGRWISTDFEPPSRLRFMVVGHNGLPSKTDQQKNWVQLSDAVTGEELRRAYPPRSDTGVSVEWDLSEYRNRRVRIECVDGDAGTAYAWIGVGGFSLAQLTPSDSREIIEKAMALRKAIPFVDEGDDCFASLYSQVDHHLRLRLLGVSAIKTRPFASQLLEQVALQGWTDKLPQLSTTLEKLSPRVDGWNESLESQIVSAMTTVANSSQQSELVKTMASKKEWHAMLLDMLERGKIGRDSLAVLGEPWWNTLGDHPTHQKLKIWKPSDGGSIQKRLKAMEFRVNSLASIPPDLERGAVLFKDRCSQCHQLAGVGKVLGPQLEGVGGRGLKRLAEDILLPNQNVDEAFRTSTILMTDGEVKSGWVRQRLGQTIVLADQKGESTTLAVESIESEKANHTSLMPDNFGELLSDVELSSLIGYLQSQASKAR